MTSPLQRHWIATAVATTLIGLTLPSMAQPMPMASAPHQAGPAGAQHDHSERLERMKARMAERQGQLREKLQLSSTQEPAWQAFVQGMQAPDRSHGAREDWQALNTPQRLDRIEAIKAQRDQDMAQRHQTIRRFYAQLNPDQQKVFDAEGLGGLRHAGMRGASEGKHHKHSHPRM